MAITVNVINETYRVYPTGRKVINATKDNDDNYVPARPDEYVDHDKMMDAVRHALKIASEIGCDIIVDRVTHHEPITEEMAPNDLFGELVGRAETVTGELYIPMSDFRNAPELSRYHPNNGWVLPQTIEIK